MMQRISRLLIAACAFVAAACSDSTSPPAPTTIVLSSPSLTLDAIGATQSVTATVKDQRDQPMAAAAVTWSSSSGAVTAVSTTGTLPTAIITAVLNGESVVTATSGSATTTLKVTVAQTPASVQLLGGNAQVGAVATALATPIGVRVLDRLGAPVANQVVTFTVAQGGGALSTPTATTNTDGAAYVTWTLGKSTRDAQQVTATLGALSPATFTATATAGAPATVTVSSGNSQTATVGSSLSVAPSVLVADAFGNPVANAAVTFTTNSGIVANPNARTNDVGVASAGLWTLGGTPGAKTLTASLDGGLTATFGATALVGPPAIATILAGNNQSATVGTAVAVAPSVRVSDAFGNVIPQTTVTFAVTSGGGAVAGGTTLTDANGVATVGSWTLGPNTGTNTLTATAGTNAGTAFTATGTSSAPTGGASSISANSTLIQAAMAGTAATANPSVIVRDAAGNPVSNALVTFTVTAGSGSVTGGLAVTNASGIATVGSWTLGSTANVNTLNAHLTTGATVIFTAAGCEGGGGAGYAITVCYRTPMSDTQRQAFVSAAAKWSSIITSDLPDLQATIGQDACDTNSPAMNMTVDDLVIFAAIEPIDGVNNVLGSAGWCYRRSGGLPIIGSMRFDIADVAGLESTNRLNSVILHEMGHVIGIGTMWAAKGLLQSPSTASLVTDTYFSGTSALAGFNAIGGLTYTGGQKVPVENTGGAGTMNAHWRESVLANELMTGYLNNGSNPLSVLTVRSLEDIGYTVNASAADPFALALSLRSSLGGDPGALNLGNDVYTGPQSTIDSRGRIVRIR